MLLVDKSSTLYIVKAALKRPDKEAFKQVFADNLFEARIATNFSQATVGKCIGMAGNSYAKYEQADSMLPLVHLEPICEKLYISPWQLLTGRPQGNIKELPARLRNTTAKKAKDRLKRATILAKNAKKKAERKAEKQAQA